MPGNRNIGLRLTERQHTRIKAAADKQHRSVSSFLLHLGLTEADRELGEEQSVPVPELVSTTVQPEQVPEVEADRPLMKLNTSYPRLPESLYEKVDLWGAESGAIVKVAGKLYTYLP